MKKSPNMVPKGFTPAGKSESLGFTLACTSESHGFTLIETFVAVTLLTVAVVAPMALASQSLQAAYYSRDQITASYLAQDAIEAVRKVRDDNNLNVAINGGTPSWGLPTGGTAFIVDDTVNPIWWAPCGGSGCPPVQTNGELYGYPDGRSGWSDTNFTRTVVVEPVLGNDDVMRVSVTVSWRTGPYQIRTFTLSDVLYLWVTSNSASN